MYKKGVFKWINVEKEPNGSFHISSTHNYLIVSGQLLDGTLDYNVLNVLASAGYSKFFDTMGMGGDLFTRLNFLANAELHSSTLRSGVTSVNEFSQVQIIEYQY